MRTITVNGITYPAKTFGVNTVCDLDEMGISTDDYGTKPMSLLRGYIALCIGRGKDYAGEQIEQHIVNGGDLNGIMEVMAEMIGESDFFRSLQERTAENTPETPKKRTTKKTIAE